MNITFEKKDKTLTAVIEGALDTATSPEAEKLINPNLDGIEKLILDFEKLEYISSAGLRLVINLAQSMDEKDGMIIKNPNDDVAEVFELTGLTELFSLK